MGTTLEHWPGEGETDAVKPSEGDADAELVMVGSLEGEAPDESVAEGEAVMLAGGVPLGVGRLEPVAEGVAEGSW